VISVRGIDFTPVKPTSDPIEAHLVWSEISRLTLIQVTGVISKVEVLVGGYILAWRVSGRQDLYAALHRLQQSSQP
jgi:hypothetical protein